jgi:hypothetical protein
MHVEPGVVDAAKIVLSYGTAAAAGTYTMKLSADAVRQSGLGSIAARSAIATGLVFCFFEVLPHAPVGVSEVHLILGTMLMLVLGVVPTAIGLALGLLAQGLFFAPSDLPQYTMNVTTLLVPLFAMKLLADRMIPAKTAFVDLSYSDLLKLSAFFQGGVIAWVGFWVTLGQGASAETFSAFASFAAAYTLVILIEPVVSLGVLAAAKALRGRAVSSFVTPRLYSGV